MGDVGKEKYLPLLAQRYIMDHSERVNFKARTAITKISPMKGKAACEQHIDNMPEIASKEKLKKVFGASLERSDEWIGKTLTAVSCDTFKLRKRISNARTYRNYRFQEALPSLLEIVTDVELDEQLRVHLIEALGWFFLSHNRSDIVGICDDIIAQTGASERLKAEALKTKYRILQGPNNVLTP
jgi:hypothetical protein